MQSADHKTRKPPIPWKTSFHPAWVRQNKNTKVLINMTYFVVYSNQLMSRCRICEGFIFWWTCFWWKRSHLLKFETILKKNVLSTNVPKQHVFPVTKPSSSCSNFNRCLSVWRCYRAAKSTSGGGPGGGMDQGNVGFWHERPPSVIVFVLTVLTGPLTLRYLL